MRRIITIIGLAALCAVAGRNVAGSSADAPDGWAPKSPRDEIRPAFSFDPHGGPGGKGSLVITAAPHREELDGSWTRTFAVEGGKHYRFTALRQAVGVTAPRRSCVVELTWRDDAGKLVRSDDGGDMARPEFPRDRGAGADGWTRVADTYTAPAKATRAVVDLQLRWAPGGSVRWADVALTPTDQAPSRKVRLAAVHYRPHGGKTPADNCRLFAPLIKEAADKGADLVCLPECLTLYGNGYKYASAAEPIPGPSTQYFGQLARQHNLYIVGGLLERVGPTVYNVAVLLGPDGKLIGKYRKVCLPREEIEGGVTPGHEYPVFDTRFGKLGMMICWDVHFPEVARNLANHGAEVIAMPIWGGMQQLAAARAIENQIYLVTSTFTDYQDDWMKTAVWDHEGKRIAEATQWGQVIVAEVDLAVHKHWWYLGDFKNRIPRERPIEGFIK